MGRPRIGDKLKKPSDYIYNFPENKEMAKHLEVGDLKRIARVSKYSKGYISMILQGKRRMPKKIQEYVKKLIEINKVRDDILLKDINEAIKESDVIDLRQLLNKVHKKLATVGDI